MNALLFAIQFLTRLPVPLSYQVNEHVQQQSFYWHGVVGLLIGALLLFAGWFCQRIFVDAPLLQAAVLLVVWVAITGALHLDGLGDSADAWLGGYGDQCKTLRIMKDPTSGPAAVVWIALVLLLKFAALAVLIQQQTEIAILFAPLIGRLGSMCLWGTTPYVREQGMATGLIKNMNPKIVYGQCGLAVVALLLLGNLKGVVALLLAACTWFYARHLMISRIQGTTGDTAGALIEWLEAVTLLGFCMDVL